MKPETAQMLAKAFTDTVRDVGLTVEEVVAHVLVAPLDEEWKEFARQAQQNGLAHQLEQLPQPTEQEIANALAAAERFKSTPLALRQGLKDILKDLPRSRGGPPRGVPIEDELRVCAEVEALANNYDSRQAVQLVAKKWNVGERTIYRVMSKHGRTKPRRPKKTEVK